jgi:hypothetical protein
MPDKPKDRVEIALEGYRELAAQLRHEESISWKRLETFLVISSALVALIGLFWPGESPVPVILGAVPAGGAGGGRGLLTVLISLIGFLLSLGWIVVVRRSEAFHDFRYLQLVDLEKSTLEALTVFTTADEYFDKGTATIGGKPHHLDWISRRARIYQVMTAVPIVFAAMWGILLAYFVTTGILSVVQVIGVGGMLR